MPTRRTSEKDNLPSKVKNDVGNRRECGDADYDGSETLGEETLEPTSDAEINGQVS